MNSPADLTVLVSYEIFDAMMYFALDPADDPVEKMMNEIGTRLRLVNRETPHPWKRRRAECHGDKPFPISSYSAHAKSIDELGHSIRVAEIATARCAVLSASEWAAQCARAKFPEDVGSFALARLDAGVGIRDIEPTAMELNPRPFCFAPHCFPLRVDTPRGIKNDPRGHSRVPARADARRVYPS